MTKALWQYRAACGKKQFGESENVKRDCGVLVGAFGGSPYFLPLFSDFFLLQTLPV